VRPLECAKVIKNCNVQGLLKQLHENDAKLRNLREMIQFKKRSRTVEEKYKEIEHRKQILNRQRSVGLDKLVSKREMKLKNAREKRQEQIRIQKKEKEKLRERFQIEHTKLYQKILQRKQKLSRKDRNAIIQKHEEARRRRREMQVEAQKRKWEILDSSKRKSVEGSEKANAIRRKRLAWVAERSKLNKRKFQHNLSKKNQEDKEKGNESKLKVLLVLDLFGEVVKYTSKLFPGKHQSKLFQCKLNQTQMGVNVNLTGRVYVAHLESSNLKTAVICYFVNECEFEIVTISCVYEKRQNWFVSYSPSTATKI